MNRNGPAPGLLRIVGGDQGQDRRKIRPRGEPKDESQEANVGKGPYELDRPEGDGGQQQGKENGFLVSDPSAQQSREKERSAIADGGIDKDTARRGMADGKFILHERQDRGKDRPGGEV